MRTLFKKAHTYVALLLLLATGILLYAFVASPSFPPKATLALTGEKNAIIRSAPHHQDLSTTSSDSALDPLASSTKNSHKAVKDPHKTPSPPLIKSPQNPRETAGDHTENAYEPQDRDVDKTTAKNENHHKEQSQESPSTNAGPEKATRIELPFEISENPATHSLHDSQTSKHDSHLSQSKAGKESSALEARATPETKAPVQIQAKVIDKKSPYLNPNKEPEIVLIVEGLGRRQETIELSLALPSEITLAFHSFKSVASLAEAAHAEGHEILIMIPMEPLNYPENDPGPMTLLTGLEASENVGRLKAHLENLPKCVGVLPFQGARFLLSKKDLIPIFGALKHDHLFFIETGHTRHSIAQKLALKEGFDFQKIDYHLDSDLTKEAVLKKLVALEKSALEKGRAYAVTQDVPMVLEVLRTWSEKLVDKKIRLAPVSVCFTKVQK